jgi:hypothetical protein
MECFSLATAKLFAPGNRYSVLSEHGKTCCIYLYIYINIYIYTPGYFTYNMYINIIYIQLIYDDLPI